uniref:RNA helicase n=1 Tax=Rhabditophanes sp. KR3021 TaxID=114890 RepID=A0AC35TUZ3_9BILA
MSKEEISLLNKVLNHKLEELRKGTVEVSFQQQNPDSPLYSVDNFYSLRLKNELLERLAELGFLMPSNIQATALPLLLMEPPTNLIAQSQSGTGKTATFVLTMLHKVDVTKNYPQCLCMAPTLELAKQIGEVIQSLGQKIEGLKLYYATKEGKLDLTKPITDHIIIGTPGRLIDMIQKHNLIDVSKLLCFVLDEADVMVSEQHFRTMTVVIHKFITAVNPKVQSMLFAATFDEEVRILSKNNNITIYLSIKKEMLALDSIKQFYVKCENRDKKYQALSNLYNGLSIASTIIFCHTKASADWITEKLRANGRKVLSLHGGFSAEERTNIVQQFRNGVAKVLVTTNVSSRGLDFPQVTLVLNYDLPVIGVNMDVPDYESYYHRIGRTGRFGKSGISINLIDSEQSMVLLTKFQEYFQKEILPLDTDDYDQIEAIQK